MKASGIAICKKCGWRESDNHDGSWQPCKCSENKKFNADKALKSVEEIMISECIFRIKSKSGLVYCKHLDNPEDFEGNCKPEFCPLKFKKELWKKIK